MTEADVSCPQGNAVSVPRQAPELTSSCSAMGPNLFLLLLLGLAGKVQIELNSGPHIFCSMIRNNYTVVATRTCVGPGRQSSRCLCPCASGWAGRCPQLLSNIPTSFPSLGQGSAGSIPEVVQAPVGDSIAVQCLYRLQDVKARKMWCRFSPEGCQPLASSAVDRRAPRHGRLFLTDLGSGLLQVEMIDLREEDAGEYGCVVEGTTGPQTVHRVTLDILPAGELS